MEYDLKKEIEARQRIGGEFSMLREKRGLTQQEVADMLEIKDKQMKESIIRDLIKFTNEIENEAIGE